MEKTESFQGAPWNTEPTEDWNRPSYWHNYYGELFAEADPWRRGRVIHREVDLLIRMLTEAGELPRSSPQTLLDAGCGIALIPHVLAYWGFQVAAIDSCPRTVQYASPQQPSEKELALCVPIWDPCKALRGARELVNDPARSMQRLRSFRAVGGSVEYIVDDWFTANLRRGTFGVVLCRNSLRCSTKSYWRRSLHQFSELLVPGGILLLENVNAIGIREEVEDLLAKCGFLPLAPGTSREPSSKYVFAMWPTG